MITEQKALGTKATLGNKPEPEAIFENISLGGKRAVVTGGYSGIGLETVRALAQGGADVMVPARRVESAKSALASLPKTLQARIQIAHMDLTDLNSVRKFTADMIQQGKAVDLLINNAGIMACPETRIGPGWEAQFGVNHLGHFALTGGLLDLLKKAANARVVCLSSIAHRRADIQWDDIHFAQTAYDKWNAYAQAKTANALFALGLDQQMKHDGIRAFSVHPGGILTPLQRHMEKEEMMAMGWIDENGEIPEAAKPFFKTPSQGAATSLWAATSPALNDKGGVYCEDCDIANIMTEASVFCDVAPHACDIASAQRLWELSLEMTT